VVNHADWVPETGKTGWHKIADYDTFVKWQYGDTPYRVIVDLDENRGHYRAVFTSWYPGKSYLIRGNCGGDSKGRMLALTAAMNWMEEHKYGCPPPGEMATA
jgi:hypothetical protein